MKTLFSLISLCLLSSAMAYDWCDWYPKGRSYPPTVKYCDYGCCYTLSTVDPCCSGLSVGSIVGIVIGGIIFIITITVAVILGRRRYVRRTTIYTTQPPPMGSTVVTSTSNYQAGYNQPQVPPPYPGVAGQNYKTF